MSEVNDYANYLLKRNKAKLPEGMLRQPAGRPFGTGRTGSVLAGKKQTLWEASITSTKQTFHKNRWALLFAEPLNKWKP
jgi:hypothetical protein